MDQQEIAKEEESAPQKGPRDRILDASLKLFVEQGYFNTNVPDISRESKCSVGSIYHHFLNKEEIADQLFKNGIQEFRAALSTAFEADDNVEATIRRLLIAFMAFAEDNQLLARYLWLNRHSEFISDKVSKPTMIGFDSFGRRLTRVIRTGAKKGEIPILKAEIFWSIVFGIPLSFIRDWLEGYTTTSPSEAAPIIAEACWSALQGTRNAT